MFDCICNPADKLHQALQKLSYAFSSGVGN